MSTTSATVSKNTKEYRCRQPQYSPYCQCIEDKSEKKIKEAITKKVHNK
ncbi:MAG: hypothetical protein ACYDIA_03495 [Candidatus Humimicrobiaceae bacterium]